jgi:RimJ/RimL family protein N-acetyltransferase
MMARGPTLETERLILRPTVADDFAPWCAMMADEEVARYIGGVAAPSAVWRLLCTVAGAWTLFGYSMFSVVEKATGRWVGRVGPWTPADWPGPEIGWGFTRDVWGRGYATEGATAAMTWTFDHLGWTDVIHCIDPANRASARVAERLGSRYLRLGAMPPPYDDHPVEIWGQRRDDWRARQSSRST